MAQFIGGWEERLSKADTEKVEWIRAHKATIYVSVAPPDPPHNPVEGIELEVVINEYSLFRTRGTEDELSTLIHKAYLTVKNMFDFVHDR